MKLPPSRQASCKIEMSQSSWLVAGVLPGIERQPRKKLEPNAEGLLGLLHRWRDEAIRAGKKITRVAVAFEAGRDGFWLARWLEARGVEAHVIHPSSVAVSREHRRAKTDRLDTELLKRGFLGWLRGERGHCSIGARANDCRRGRQAAEPGARMPGGRTHANCEPDKVHPGPAGHSRLQTNPARACPREGGGRPNVWQPCTPRRACRCRQMLWPSCSAIWRGWALLSARSERSRTLVRNDWNSSLRPGPTPWFGYWPELSVLVSRRLICWSMRCCHGQCVTAEPWRATPT